MWVTISVARSGVSFCRKREVTEGGGAIQNLLEQSGIAGGGIDLGPSQQSIGEHLEERWANRNTGRPRRPPM